MANKSLFSAALAKIFPRTDTVNHAGGTAYSFEPEARLAQLVATGTLHDTVYTSAQAQIQDVLEALRTVDPLFVAKAAVYARRAGAMKDMPALLTAYLTIADPDLAVRTFHRVMTSGRMIRTFVQIMRSGQIGRTSLGSRPKRLVQQWLEGASMRDLMAAATGSDPSLADIVRMVHPKPQDLTRQAFYGWLLGKPYDVAALPQEILLFERWKQDRALPLPPVPFEWLTAFPLTAGQWTECAGRMGWQALRMNLNTLARHGVFETQEAVDSIAARLSDPAALKGVRPQPYQVMTALSQLDGSVPLKIHAALEQALERSLEGVPALQGRIVVCPDVSGSMQNPLTGYRKGATTVVRCVDVAALITAAILRKNRFARVIPFEQTVVSLALSPRDRVAVNAAKLAEVGGGGTCVSAPLELLNRERSPVDLVIIVSDNESWIDPQRYGATATMAEWATLKRRCPQAKLICIDLTPYASTQAPDRQDILNVGGFSDDVFTVMTRFLSVSGVDWPGLIRQCEV